MTSIGNIEGTLSLKDHFSKQFRLFDQSLDRAGKGMDGASRKANAMGAAIGGVGAALAGAFSVRAAADIGRQILTIGGRFEQLEVRLKTLTGSAEAGARAFTMIQEAAKATPFTVDQLTESFARLSAVGIRTTSSDMQTIADVAASSGKDVLQFAEAVADASTGEFERLKEFGIVARSVGDEVTLTFDGVATTVQKNSAEVTAALLEIGRTRFAGGAAAQMDTLDGKLSNLQDAWDRLAKAIFDSGVGDAAKRSLGIATDAVSALGAAVSLLGGDFDEAEASAQIAMMRLQRDVLQAVTSIIDQFNRLPRLLRAAFGASGSTKVAEDFRRMARELDNMIRAAAGSDKVADGVRSIGGAVAEASDEIKAMGERWEKLGELTVRIAQLQRELAMEMTGAVDPDAIADRLIAATEDAVDRAAEMDLPPLPLDFEIPDAPVQDEWNKTVDEMGASFQDGLGSIFEETFQEMIATGELSWEGLLDSLKRLFLAHLADMLKRWILHETQKTAQTAKQAAARNAMDQGGGGGGGGMFGGGGMGGMGALGTAGAVIGAFVAFYELVSARQASNREDRYGGAIFANPGGGDRQAAGSLTQGMTGAEGSRLAQEISTILNGITFSLGGFAADLGSIGFRFAQEGDKIKVTVGDTVVAIVKDLDDGIAAGIRYILHEAGDGLEGISDTMRQLLEGAIARGAQLDELQEIVKLGQAIDALDLPDEVAGMRQAFSDFAPVFTALRSFGVDSEVALRMLGKALEEFTDSINDRIDRFLDPTGAMAQVRAFEELQAAAIGANAEIERQADVMGTLVAEEINLRKARENAADQLNPLEAGNGGSPGQGEGGPSIEVAAVTVAMDTLSETAGGLIPVIEGAAQEGDIFVGTVDDVGSSIYDTADAMATVRDALPDPIDLDDLARAALSLRDQLAIGLGNELLQYVDNHEVRMLLAEAEHRLKVMQYEAQFAALVAQNQLVEASLRLTEAQLGAFRTAIDTFSGAGPGIVYRPPTIHRPSGGGSPQRDQAEQDMDRLRDILADRAFEMSLSGMSEMQAALAQLNRQREEELELAHGNADLIAQVNEQFEQLAETLRDEFQQDAIGAFADFLGVNDGPFASLTEQFESVREQMLEAFAGPNGEIPERLAFQLARLNNEYERQLAALVELGREQALDPFQSSIDRANGVGGVERGLMDLMAQAEEARQSLIDLAAEAAEAGQSTEWLAGDLADLDAGLRVAIQQMGVDFVNSLGALGAAVPDDVVLELAQAQWQLARAEAVSAAMALAAAGAFDGLSFTLEDLLGWIDEASFETSDFAPSFGDLGSGFSDFVDTARDELEGLRDWFNGMLTGPNSPLTISQQFVEAQREYDRLLGLVRGGDTSQAGNLQQAADLLLSLGGQVYGTAGAGYAGLFAEVRADIGRILGVDGGGTVIDAQARFAAASERTADSVDAMASVIDLRSDTRDQKLDELIAAQRSQLDELAKVADAIKNSSRAGSWM